MSKKMGTMYKVQQIYKPLIARLSRLWFLHFLQKKDEKSFGVGSKNDTNNDLLKEELKKIAIFVVVSAPFFIALGMFLSEILSRLK